MLAGLGIAADLDSDVTFAEATGDLVTDVATDLYVADYGRDDSPLPPDAMPFGAAAGLAAGARRRSGPPAFEPHDAEPGPPHRYEFAKRARDEVAKRKRAMRVMDYNDLLTYLRAALMLDTGEEACQRIRARYQILVLVDEFQDTDPLQWDILERAFHGHRTLILVGDPKRAIYAFRGADIVTYLQAKRAALGEATLGTNWRSDQPLVRVAAPARRRRARRPPHPAVRRQRRAPRALPAQCSRQRAGARAPSAREEFDESTSAKLTVANVRPFVARDVAADIVRLLASGAELVERDGVRRPLEGGRRRPCWCSATTPAPPYATRWPRSTYPSCSATSSVFASDAARSGSTCSPRWSSRSAPGSPATPRSPASSAGPPSAWPRPPGHARRSSAPSCVAGRRRSPTRAWPR